MKYNIILMIMLTGLFAEEKYNEPQYKVLEKDGAIELREYGEYVVAKTSINKNYDSSENNMFRTLASYIFGNNHDNAKIPMTAPVTTLSNKNSFEMIFYMLDADNVSDLPGTDIKNIEFGTFNLGKCVVISFSWFTSEDRISKYKKKLDKYISDNNYEIVLPYMVNRYDPPWKLPFLRRNEVLVKVR